MLAIALYITSLISIAGEVHWDSVTSIDETRSPAIGLVPTCFQYVPGKGSEACRRTWYEPPISATILVDIKIVGPDGDIGKVTNWVSGQRNDIISTRNGKVIGVLDIDGLELLLCSGSKRCWGFNSSGGHHISSGYINQGDSGIDSNAIINMNFTGNSRLELLEDFEANVQYKVVFDNLLFSYSEQKGASRDYTITNQNIPMLTFTKRGVRRILQLDDQRTIMYGSKTGEVVGFWNCGKGDRIEITGAVLSKFRYSGSDQITNSYSCDTSGFRNQIVLLPPEDKRPPGSYKENVVFTVITP